MLDALGLRDKKRYGKTPLSIQVALQWNGEVLIYLNNTA